jgi:lipopolysaccharide/colanic/teichoic acid biosynthesis glycosyltransferase
MVNQARYRVVGRLGDSPAATSTAPGAVPWLGDIDDIGRVVAAYRVDLVLMSADVPRLPVFHAFHDSCLESPARLTELSDFYEDALGHVPVAAINAAWFQYMMRPDYRASTRITKRCFDVTAAIVAGVALLPLMVVLGLLIRRDGGPAIHRQTRIGARGRPFTLYKLRTMHPVESPAQWSSADDLRVTRIGRVLRAKHIDELPQLLNVLRGEMSIVGPRPEQPELVARLERELPFYQRRHLIKPGITGWAQVRCGYAGSVAGSAWKLCHDLYYIKRRCLILDFLILVETARALFGHREDPAERSTLAYMLGLRPANCTEPSPVAARGRDMTSASVTELGLVAAPTQSE